MAKTTEDGERIEQQPEEQGPEEHRQSLQKPRDQNQPAGKDQNRTSMEPYSPEIYLG